MRKYIGIILVILVVYLMLWVAIYDVTDHSGGQAKSRTKIKTLVIGGKERDIVRVIFPPYLITRDYIRWINDKHNGFINALDHIWYPVNEIWKRYYTLDFTGYVDENGLVIEYKE